MASSCSGAFQSSESAKHSDIASQARANAEYFFYCAQWWWDMFLCHSRGEYSAEGNPAEVACECAEPPTTRGEGSQLCECSSRRVCEDYGGLDSLYSGSPCCGDAIEVPTPSVNIYGRHCFDYDINNYNNQSYDQTSAPACWTDIHGHCNDSNGYTKVDDQGDVGTEKMEMEVNEDFRKFLEQSKRYRQERDKSKQANRERPEEDYIEVGSVPVIATSRPPSEQQGFERKKAMKELYGQKSEHIMSLETSLQLNYDRNCDVRRPIFWPSIPLKF